ncbi:hypothetical protein GCM10025738_30750 [Microbacterium fluvii]
MVSAAADTTSETPSEAIDVQASSDPVTVTRKSWSINVAVSVEVLWPSETTNVNVTLDQDLADTNGLYSLYIVEIPGGQVIGQCDTGTVCDATISWSQLDDVAPSSRYYVAYVALRSSAPVSSGESITGIIGGGGSTGVRAADWEITVTPDDVQELAAGDVMEVHVSTNQDVGDTGGRYVTYIVDYYANKVVKTCDDGYTCDYETSFYTEQDRGTDDWGTFIAYVGSPGATTLYGETGIQNMRVAGTDPTWMYRKHWDATMKRTSSTTVTLTSNQDVSKTNGYFTWYLYYIADGPVASPVLTDTCDSGPRCVFSASAVGPGHYEAFLARKDTEFSSSGTPANYLAWTYLHLEGPQLPQYPNLTSATGRGEMSGGGNPAQGSCDCGRADPVNTATGEFYLSESDISLAGQGPLLTAERTYSTTGAGSVGAFGHGWTSGLDTHLSILADTDDANPLPRQIEVQQENGSILVFTRNELSSTFSAPERVRATLTWDDSDSEWLLVRNGTQYMRFSEAGNLLAVADPDGNTTTLVYSAGKLSEVRASGGRELSIEWTGGRISEITDSAGRAVLYTYDDDDLVSVTGVDGVVTAYEYDNSHLLTAIVQPGGGRTENVYDDVDRVISQSDPLERITTFTYDYSGTVTTWPDGSQTIDRYAGGMLIEQVLTAGTDAEAITQYTYNELNLLSSVLGPEDGLTTYTYDEDGRRLSQSDALGRESTWTYGTALSPLTFTDPEGGTTTSTYNEAGHPLTITSPGGAEQSWTYNSDGTVATYETATGATTVYDYDSAGRNTSVVDAELRETSFSYNGFGMPISTIAPGGAATTTSYDDAGRTIAVEDPLGRVTSYVYDDDGNLTSVTNAEAETTTYAYDDAGQNTLVTDPEGDQTAMVYDAVGRVASVTDPLGHTTRFTHDSYGNTLTSTDPLDRTSTATYDLAGRLLQTQTPSGATTSYARDTAGQVTAVTDALGNTTSFGYNDAGQVTSIEDPLGRLTTTTYDAEGRVDEVTLPDLSTQSYEYDLAGNVTGFTNADGFETSYEYTDTGLLSARTDPGNLVTAFEYNNAGRLSVKTLPDGSETAYTYNAGGQVIGVAYSSSATQDVSYEYDDAQRVTSITDATGTTTLEYDKAGRIVTETDGGGEELGYTYDAAGRLTSVDYPVVGAVEYGYNAADEMTTATDWADRVTELTWDADGQLATETAPNGVVQAWTYDAAGRTTEVSTERGTAELAAFDYTYDDAGQLTQQTTTLGTSEVTVDFEHDSIGQLSSTTTDDGASTPTTIAITATPGGQLVVTDDGAELTYNTAQQVVERDPASGSTTTYSYNTNGARNQTTVSGSPAQTTSYGYDAAGYLSSVSTGGTTVEYETDGRGLRQSRSTGTIEDFLWSTTGSLPLMVADGDNYYLYAAGSTPIAQIDKTSGEARYLARDDLGSVRLSTDNTGTVLGSQTFSEFGTPTSSAGSIDTPFGFTGNWTDAETGFVHLRARDYDPDTGQFINVDPALDTTKQPYTYAGNNPVQYTDNTGLDFWSDLGTNLAAFGAGVLNGATFGLSGLIMSAVIPGYDCFVQENQGFYAAGDVVGMVASTVAVSVVSAGGLGAAALGARVAVSAAAKVGAGAVRSAVRITTAKSLPRVAATTSSRNLALSTPKVASGKLQNLVDNLYKGTANPNRVGSGTTMDAVRSELSTGVATGGKMHSTKAQESVNGLQNWLKKNPDASYSDRLVAQSLLDDLRDALGGAQ